MKEASDLLSSPASKQWQSISIKDHHGIAIPLFSIHSVNSCGIGEYTDLPLLIDWCASIGFDVIQLLPVNDTGMGKSPYSAISAFALNPLFIGLNGLPYLKEYPFLKDELEKIPKFEREHIINYELVRQHKGEFLRHYFELLGSKIIQSDAYQEFLQITSSWLKQYAVFKLLKIRYNGASWEAWPTKESLASPEIIELIANEEKEEVNWHCFLQYLCYQQLKAAKTYATNKQILIMGDIPILIDRDSADVWLHREQFDLNFSAGAPPDMYSEEGQNWGFPLYQWNIISKNDYEWWISRLRWAAQYFHIYRIDHIVGFFRIWSIPYGGHGKEGCFVPKDESTWIEHGQAIMSMMLNASNMLPIGEDLGVVPTEVRKCLSRLGICGTKVMRWERKWEEKGQFISPKEYQMDSLTTVSTHDSETLQLWWINNPIEAQIFASFKGWTYEPFLSLEHQREILWDSHHSGSLFHINLLQEYLALIPELVWPDPEKERINIPGLIADRNWSYRLRPNLEQLLENQTLKNIMNDLIN